MDDTLKHLRALNSCTLVTTGRTGSDFFQSLLDSHPQVLTFNGSIIEYYDFWNNSKCVKSSSFDLSDFIYEFIGKYIERFKSRYDHFERKDQLGKNYNQSINININQFSQYFIEIMNNNDVTPKNCLLSIYGAYAMVLGQDINQKTLFFHHIHHHKGLELFIKDFPDTKIISMTRDPRANIVSGVYNHKKYAPDSMMMNAQFSYISRILYDSSVLDKLKNEFISIRIEDLGYRSIINKIINWLEIDYNTSLEKSTWAGLIWNGDRISRNKRIGTGFSKSMLVNDWQDILTSRDKYILNFLMYIRLKHYKYHNKKPTVISYFILPALCILPMSYEKEVLSLKYIIQLLKQKNIRLLITNYFYYSKRIMLFLKFYLKTLKNQPFKYPYIHCD